MADEYTYIWSEYAPNLSVLLDIIFYRNILFATLDQSWFWPNWRKKLNSSDSNWCMTTWILLQCTGVAGGLDSDYTKSRTGFRFLGLIILARFLFENLSDYAAIGCSLECDCLKGRCKSLDQSHWEVKAISDYLQLLIENNFSLN